MHTTDIDTKSAVTAIALNKKSGTTWSATVTKSVSSFFKGKGDISASDGRVLVIVTQNINSELSERVALKSVCADYEKDLLVLLNMSEGRGYIAVSTASFIKHWSEMESIWGRKCD